MKTITAGTSRHNIVSGRALVARLRDFAELTKPRVMMLAVFTALVGLNSAPRELYRFHTCLVALAIAMGAGAAGVLNMWYDADIDAVMARTAMRPISQGKGVWARGDWLWSNARRRRSFSFWLSPRTWRRRRCSPGAIFFYIVVYTAWLKRSTPQNIVIGGAAGALPPVIGWTAATGSVSANRSFYSSSFFSGRRHTSGRSRSIARTTMRGQACRCSRLSREGRPRNARS